MVRATRRAAVALLATLPMLAGLMTPATARPVTSADVPSFCPLGTISSERIIGEDFDPGTPETVGAWTSVGDGGFAAIEHESEWILRGQRPVGQYGVTRSAGAFNLPHGRKIFLVLDHRHEMGEVANATVDIVHDTNQAWLRFNDSSTVSEFRGTAPRRRSYVDVTGFAGHELDLTLALSSEKAATWDIYDLSVVTCDRELASGPSAVTGTPGRLGEARISWSPPVWRPDKVTGYIARLIDVADEARNRTADLTVNARSWRFTGLAQNRDYRLEISAKGGGTSAATRPLYGTRIGLTSSVNRSVLYPDTVFHTGDVLARGDDLTVLLQGRAPGSTAWQDLRRSPGHLGEWAHEGKTTRNYEYRAVITGGAYSAWSRWQVYNMGSSTPIVRVTVRTRVSMLVNGQGKGSHELALGGSFRLTGWVTPTNPGKPIKLQRYYDGAWHTVSTRSLDSFSKYGFTVRPPKRGDLRYRVYAPAHERNGYGKSVTLPVRVS